MLSERAHAVAAGLSSASCQLSLFLVSLAFPVMEASVGLTGVFVAYTAGALAAAASSAMFLPETRERTHAEVAGDMRNRTVFLKKDRRGAGEKI